MRIDTSRAAALLIGVTVATLHLPVGLARADQFAASYTPNSSVLVGITYTLASGKISSLVLTDPVPIKVTPGTLAQPTGSSFTAFSIDLWHAEKTPTNFQATTATSGFRNAVIPAAVTPSVADPKLTNELNYLGSVFSQLSSSNKDQTGALQLAIWHLIDKNFTVRSWPATDKTLQADYNAITGSNGLLAGFANKSLTGTSIAGYASGNVYLGGKVLVVNQKYQPDENLVAWPNGVTDPPSLAPEPSTVSIAGLGALAFLGYGLWRRKPVTA
jgi:hypothetical protein